MRWGIRDDVQIEHREVEACLEEINNCREMSVGPYFVVGTSIVSDLDFWISVFVS